MASILAACSSDTTTTTSTTSTAPSTTALTTSTTESAAEPVDICSRGLLWDVGSTYEAGCFIVPLSFEPDEDGWRSGGGGDSRIRIDWREPGGDVAIRIAVLAHEPQLEPASALENIIAIDGVHALGEVREVSVGTHGAMAADVHTDPDPQGGPEALDFDECSSQQGLVTWGYDVWPGYPLVYDPQSSGTEEYGLGACATFRVWVVDIDGTTVTILATTDDQARFEELMPTVEGFFESMSVGA